MYANIIVDKSAKNLDKTFSYSIPLNMVDKITIGDRVVIPFGRSNKKIEGLVYEIVSEESTLPLKDIVHVLDKRYSFTKGQIYLIEKLRTLYASTYQRAYFTILPAVQTLNIKTSYILKTDMLGFEQYDKITKDKLTKLIRSRDIHRLLSEGKLEEINEYSLKVKEQNEIFISPNFTDIDKALLSVPARNSKVIRILKYVFSLKKVEISVLRKSVNCTTRDIENLIEKSYLLKTSSIKKSNYSINTDNKQVDKVREKPTLSDEQNHILSIYEDYKNKHKTFRAVINGVTGSGKTLVYTEMARSVIASGKQVLILVPEIALTPQLISRISLNLTREIAVLHTHISAVNKSIQYRDIKSGRVKVVIGARSAIFSPFKNLGLIVIDEAHETSYKSDFTPRYDAVELMMELSKQFSIDIVLASATSKLEHIVRAKNASYQMLHMKKRATGATIPTIEVVDMLNNKIRLGDITECLYERLRDTFSRSEKAIILHNRKGYSTYRQCRECRHVEKCINCDVALSIEDKTGKAVCRYCSYTLDNYNRCSVCQGDLFDVMPAVRSVIEDLETLFPDETFVAVDSIVTASTDKYKLILDDFNEGKISALVGTQVIAKGLDFKDVTLAVVMRADQIFNSPDFTSSEKAFSLIYQLIGRAGRHKKMGTALIQTMDVENRALKYLVDYDYYSFISEENIIRKSTMFPPYSRLYSIRLSSTSNRDVLKIADRYYNIIKKLVEEKKMKLSIYSPRPQYYSRIKDKFNYYILIKNHAELHTKMVKLLYNIVIIDKYNIGDKSVDVTIDFSPTAL